MANATVEARDVIVWCYYTDTDRIIPIQCEKLTRRGVYVKGRRHERKNHQQAHFLDKADAINYAIAKLQQRLELEEGRVTRARELLSGFMANEFGATK